MRLLDRIRLESAVLRYDFWLELRGVGGRERRGLRHELRENLRSAAEDVGMERALFGIGSPKQLAWAAAGGDPTRPRWSLGAWWAAGTFGVLLLAMLGTALVVLETVRATGVVDQDVTVSVFPWLGSEFTASVGSDGGVAFGVDNAWWLLVLPLLVFLVVAFPWRRLRRRSAAGVLD